MIVPILQQLLQYRGYCCIKFNRKALSLLRGGHGIIGPVPFTLSHAAAALPFRRTRLVFSAVVMGSFAPDFEYFLRFGPYGKLGHSLPGVFFIDLPMSLVMLGLYDRYAREPLRAWMSVGIQQRFPPDPRPMVRNDLNWWALILASILVGIATHILWDSFTHPFYWPYRHLALLSYTVTLPIVGAVPCYELFQHISSVIGLVVLGVWVARRPKAAALPVTREALETQRRDRSALAVVAGIAVAAGLLHAVTSIGVHRDRHDLALLAAVAVVAAMTFFWAGVVIYGAMRTRRRSQAGPQGSPENPAPELTAPTIDR